MWQIKFCLRSFLQRQGELQHRAQTRVFGCTASIRWKSGFVAALFAIHPLYVESVAWICGGLFFLSTNILCRFRPLFGPHLLHFQTQRLFLGCAFGSTLCAGGRCLFSLRCLRSLRPLCSRPIPSHPLGMSSIFRQRSGTSFADRNDNRFCLLRGFRSGPFHLRAESLNIYVNLCLLYLKRFNCKLQYSFLVHISSLDKGPYYLTGRAK
jgi:hypothetical protein